MSTCLLHLPQCQPREAISRTGIAAASGTNTESPGPFDERAKAEQTRPSTAIEKTRHSSFDEQNLPKPKPKPKRAAVVDVSTVAP